MKLKNDRVLITGGTGKLGRALIASGLFSHVAPSRAELDITKPETIDLFFETHDIQAVIHCAALARPAICEREPEQAIFTNVIGTSHMVRGVIRYERQTGRTVRFVHISSDGVYPGTKGSYSETDETIPYNRYGWSKLGAESAVALLSNHCTVRTSFFDPLRISFDASPTDMFSSKVPIATLARELSLILEGEFTGTFNVGEERLSDFERYRRFKPTLRPCLRRDVQQEIPFTIYHDSSLNCEKWHHVRNLITGRESNATGEK
jgi:NAD(P)-dependent dehydrogenase (short-subunit alcohol dehydrogenase family)